MWSKVFVAASFTALVSAHSFISGSLDTTNQAVRGDVTSSKSTNACPKNTGPAATATIKNGAVTLFAKNFNGGKDGGLQYTAGLSTSGTAGSFKTVTVTTNGPAAPPAVTSASIVVAIPSGTDCTKACTLSLVSDGGFGDCVQISGSSGAAAAAAAPPAKAKGGKKGKGKGKKGGKKPKAAARRADEDVEEPAEDASAAPVDAAAAKKAKKTKKGKKDDKKDKKGKKGDKKGKKGDKKAAAAAAAADPAAAAAADPAAAAAAAEPAAADATDAADSADATEEAAPAKRLHARDFLETEEA